MFVALLVCVVGWLLCFAVVGSLCLCKCVKCGVWIAVNSVGRVCLSLCWFVLC